MIRLVAMTTAVGGFLSGLMVGGAMAAYACGAMREPRRDAQNAGPEEAEKTARRPRGRGTRGSRANQAPEV